MSAVPTDDAVPSGAGDFDPIHGGRRHTVYPSVGAFGDVILQNAGSTTVLPSSSAASSPWWLGQFMELETGRRTTGEVEDPLMVRKVVTNVLELRDAPWQTALLRPRQAVIAPLRQFGINLGVDIVAAIRGVGERTPAFIEAQIPSALEAMRTGLLGVTRPLVLTRPAVVLDEEEDWDDSDEGPTWLAMDALPYRGGGVMARQRSRE